MKLPKTVFVALVDDPYWQQILPLVSVFRDTETAQAWLEGMIDGQELVDHEKTGEEGFEQFENWDEDFFERMRNTLGYVDRAQKCYYKDGETLDERVYIRIKEVEVQ